MEYTTDTLVDGLAFPEGPRWRNDRLWFSDMHQHKVFSAGLDGDLDEVCELPGKPSGLGWLPDDGREDSGRLLIVSMVDRCLMRLDPDGPHKIADLSDLASYHTNDMVVDALGRAYIGNFGFDIDCETPAPRPAELIMVDRGGSARVAADELMFPNGTVISPDGRTLVVCETFASRLTAFDIEADGSLSGRRLWAGLDGILPDGCCLDAEGAIWVATVTGNQLVRVQEGGSITDRVHLETESYACMLGGDDRRTLFICTAATSDPRQALEQRRGRIETAEIAVPGAGLP